MILSCTLLHYRLDRPSNSSNSNSINHSPLCDRLELNRSPRRLGRRIPGLPHGILIGLWAHSMGMVF
jgi:hypothetical protein